MSGVHGGVSQSARPKVSRAAERLPKMRATSGAVGCDGAVVVKNNDALQQAAAAIRDGSIVAVKGLGGFHLMVDAGNEAAVRRLRQRKREKKNPWQ